jgi:hypothetical protein
MRGRRPSGPEYVERLQGSTQAKERLHVILETVAGRCRVIEACARLGISEPRFHQLRTEVLAAALQTLEPRPLGRPTKTPSAAAEHAEALQEQLDTLEVALQAAQVREEVALALPSVLQPRALEKKTRQNRRRRHRPT